MPKAVSNRCSLMKYYSSHAQIPSCSKFVLCCFSVVAKSDVHSAAPFQATGDSSTAVPTFKG